MPGTAGAPELIEVKATTVGQGRDARRLFEFTLVLQPADPQANAQANAQASQGLLTTPSQPGPQS